MRRKVIAGALILGLGLAGLIFVSKWPASPVIEFIGVRESPIGELAVFKATNTSNRPFAYPGNSASEPWLWYVTSDGVKWNTLGYRSFESFFAGWFTLAPRSSVEFFVAPPTDAATVPAPLWGDGVMTHPTTSRAPEETALFGIVVAFAPGDATALRKGERSIGYRIRDAVWEQISNAHSAGYISDSVNKRVERWLGEVTLPEASWVWVESSSADLRLFREFRVDDQRGEEN